MLHLEEDDREAILVASLDLDPDIICFSATTSQFDRIANLAYEIRRMRPRIRLGLGGQHSTATIIRERVSRIFHFSAIGEADQDIADIIEHQLSRRPDEHTVYRPNAPDDLDRLEPPRIDLFPPSVILSYPSLMFSRGCPFSCRYCMSRLGGYHAKVRWKSPSRAVEECVALARAIAPPAVYFDDDTLLKNARWVRTFLPEYVDALGLPFYCNARPETITKDIAQELRKSGCAGIGVGIEAGTEGLRSHIGRPMTDETILRAFRIIREAGLRSWSFNMVGLPGETADDIMALIRLNEKAKVDDIRISVFTPYPGVPMGDDEQLHAGFFSRWSAMTPEKRYLVKEWLDRLLSEDRLWYTESEWSDVLADLKGSQHD